MTALLILQVLLPIPELPGFDNAKTIGIPELVQRIASVNFNVTRARVQATASDRAADSAWATLLPSIGVSAGYGLMDGFAVSPFGGIGAHYYGAIAPHVTLSLQVNPIAAALGASAAGREAGASAARADAVTLAELAGALDAYFDLAAAQASYGVRLDSLRAAESLASIARALEKGGTGPTSDTLRAQTQIARQRADLLRAELSLHTTSHALAERLRFPLAVPLLAADRELRAAAWVTPRADPTDLLRRAAEHRPEMTQWQKAAQAARRSRSQAIAALAAPSVSAFYKLSEVNTDNHPELDGLHRNYGVGLFWTLSPAQWFAAEAAGARAEDAELAGDAEAKRVSREVLDAAAAVDATGSALPSAREAAGNAREAMKLTEVRYRAGTGSATEVIEAQRDLDGARLALIDALIAFNRAQVHLLAATGEPGLSLSGSTSGAKH